MAYGRMELGIVNGKSCPDDPSYFNARTSAIVPHGIDVIADGLNAERKPNGLLNVLYVGIHTEEKGLFKLLETGRILKERGVDFKMRTVGRWYTDQEEERFITTRKLYSLGDKVQCMGRKTGDDLWHEYRNADVLFFPTHYPWETMGIVQLEAMAHGLPVVATDVGASAETVRHGKGGLIVPPGDTNSLATALGRLLDDADLRETFGRNARARVELEYSVKAVADFHKSFYCDLLSKGRAAQCSLPS